MKELKNGDHFWAILQGKLVVMVQDDYNEFAVCGPWEGLFNDSEFEFIELIKRPKGYEIMKLYY